MLQATQKWKWRQNCKARYWNSRYTLADIECGRGTRGGDKGIMCDTRDSKKDKPDYCGQCKYGWQRPWGSFNDWCCTWTDVLNSRWNTECKCQKEFAENCPEVPLTSGKKSNIYSIN